MIADNSKIKVLHLITLSVVGGAQDNTFCTAELHDRTRFDVHLACNPDGTWLERAKKSADAFHSIPTLVTPIHPLKDFRALVALVRLLRRERFDLVHTHTAKAGFLGRLACWMARVPTVVHTYHAFPFHDFMAGWRQRLFIALERLVCPLTNFFVTLSDRDRELAHRLKILRAEDAETVYTGISFDKLDAAAPPHLTRAELNIPEDWKVVMTAGRLEPQKAPHLLVEAFRQVVAEHPKTLLLLAGEGELRPLVEERIAALGLREHVRLLGVRDDVPDLLRIADVFAFSSLWEAMGRALVEAMLLGRAVVAPAIYGIPEIVHHEETGLLYEVGKVEQLAAGVSRLLKHPEERERFGANARRLTRQRFDLNQMVWQIENIYERLVLQTARRIEHLTVPLPDNVVPLPIEEEKQLSA